MLGWITAGLFAALAAERFWRRDIGICIVAAILALVLGPGQHLL